MNEHPEQINQQIEQFGRGQNDTKHTKFGRDKKRALIVVIGASFFGLITSGYLENSLNWIIPNLISQTKHIDISEANNLFSSNFWVWVVTLLAVLLGTIVAGFLSKKHGVIVGLLANSRLWLLLFATTVGIFYAHVSLSEIFSNTNIIAFLIAILITGLSGGLIGQKLYSSKYDLDFGNDKLTVFGVRWFHYLWIFPFIIFPALTAVVAALYATALFWLTGFYIALHPTLWLTTIFFPVVGGLEIYISWYSLIYGLQIFYQTIRYQRKEASVLKRFIKIVVGGVIAPIVSAFAASSMIGSVFSLPTPVPGDWMVGVALIMVAPTIFVIETVGRVIQRKFKSSQNKEFSKNH